MRSPAVRHDALPAAGGRSGAGGLGVVHVTLHCSIRQALEQIRSPQSCSTGALLHQTLQT